MGTKNRSYYRNWYQHWKEEEQEKLEQSMNEVRHIKRIKWIQTLIEQIMT